MVLLANGEAIRRLGVETGQTTRPENVPVPSVYDLKPRFQALLRPVCGSLALCGVTANQITLAAVLLSALYGVALLCGGKWSLILFPVALLTRMALNAIDGMLAHEHGQTSELGAILNELGDVASDAVLYLPLGFVLGSSSLVPILFLVVLLALGEMAGIMGQVLGGPRQYQGPMGKSDRATVLGVLALASGIGTLSDLIVTCVLWMVVLLSVLTVVNRCRAAIRKSSEP